MIPGSDVVGDVVVGSFSSFSASFDVEKSVEGKSIIVVSELVGKELISHFHKYPKELKTIDRRRFEELVAEIFKGFGYAVELTKQTRDGGKDIIAIKSDLIKSKYLIECKRPDKGHKVTVHAVRELLGVKEDEKATKAILVTTAYFSPDAKLLLNKHPWELEGKEYTDLVNWIDQYISNSGLTSHSS